MAPMQELKCQRCGADLETWNVENEGLYGRCTHCKTTYLINEVERSHVVVDVRMPDALRVPARPTLSRRNALIGTGVFAAAAATGLLGLPRLRTPGGGGSAHSPVKPLWTIGGRGPGPGQFRDYIAAVTIDGQGRSAVAVSSSPVVQLFDGDGRFLTRWVTESKSPRLLAALPGGDLILDGSDAFEWRDPMTGRVRMTAPKPDSSIRSGAEKSAGTPDGGFAIYYSRDSPLSTGPKDPVPDDRVVYFRPDGSMGPIVGPLIGKVFQPDPAVPEMPDIAAMAIDGAGTIYLLFHKKEEFDTREGLYAFNSEGVFLRKIAIDQKFYGMIAATADGTLFHADPWMTRITRIKGAASSSIDMVDLKPEPSVDLGMPFEIAAFPNGDLGLATASERYLRVRWPEAT